MNFLIFGELRWPTCSGGPLARELRYVHTERTILPPPSRLAFRMEGPLISSIRQTGSFKECTAAQANFERITVGELHLV